MTQITALPPPKPRLSSKLRHAIELRVRNGLTIKKACAEAGLSSAGYFKAMKRPHVQDHFREVQQKYLAEVEHLKATAKAQAVEVAMDLMRNAKSESVRARMVEFLLADGKAPQVAVHVDARQTGGYEFARPGQKIVDVVDAEISE